MSDSGYEFECSRAELLGISPPTYEEYLKKVAEKGEVQDGADEAPSESQDLAEAVNSDETSKEAAGGKLDEFNNIIQSTQEKLHRFKASYGSLTSALKSKLGKSLDLSFSQSETNGSSQSNNELEASSVNTDKSGQSMIGTESIIPEGDKRMISNRTAHHGQSFDLSHGADGDELGYKEIELNDTNGQQVKSPETKKFLNFGFLNLGGKKE